MNKKITLPMILKNFDRITDESARLLAAKLLDYAERMDKRMSQRLREK